MDDRTLSTCGVLSNPIRALERYKGGQGSWGERHRKAVSVLSIQTHSFQSHQQLQHLLAMLFARIASFFFAVLTLGLFALANPVEKRQTDPTALVNSLQSQITSLTSQLQGINTNTPANQILAQELFSQLIDAIEEAAIQAKAGSLRKRQTDTAVADVLGSIISTLGTVLTPVVAVLPIVGPLVAEIDVALNGLVVSLDVVVTGLIDTLDSLLVGVAGILNGLGLTVLLGTLSL